MKKRKVFFEKNTIQKDTVVMCQPKKLFFQETDWTCSIACIRTILSGITENVPSESDFIKKYSLLPGPYYSKDIKTNHLLDSYDVIYGCDIEKKTLDNVLDYMEDGYYIMLESLHNYAHWMVLLGYYPLKDADIESSKLLMYDPYYDSVRLINVDEFISMWIDGNHADNKVENDFIAIR